MSSFPHNRAQHESARETAPAVTDLLGRKGLAFHVGKSTALLMHQVPLADCELDAMSSLLGRELTADEQATEALLKAVLDTQEKRTVGASIQGIARSQPAQFMAAAISMLDSQSTLEDRRSLSK